MSITIRKIAAIFLVVFLSSCANRWSYKAAEFGSGGGVALGTIYERAVFTPCGATFTLMDDQGKKYRIERKHIHGIQFAEERPQGVGTTFALELPPGTYHVVQWSLNYGRADKPSGRPPQEAKFTVEAGKFTYIGRLDANRFMEVASIEDHFDEDVRLFKRHEDLANRQIENNSINLKGWWLPDPAGKRLVGASESTVR